MTLAFPKPTKAPKKKQRKKSLRKATKTECDKLWSKYVKRGGRCYFAGKMHKGKPHECKNGLQAMHGIPRGYHGTRWDVRNGIPGCGAIHTYFTWHKEEWSFWLLSYWGRELYDEMWAKALVISKLDYDAVKWELEAYLDGTLRVAA